MASLIIISIKLTKSMPTLFAIFGTKECFVKPGKVFISNKTGLTEFLYGRIKSL